MMTPHPIDGPGGLDRLHTIRELIALGWSAEEVRRAVRTGRLVRLRRGVYAPAGALTPWTGHARLARAVARSTGAGVALSHESAAVVLGVACDAARLDRVHLTRLDAGHGKTVGGVRHHAGPLAAADVRVIDGLAVTAPARTAVDLARTAPYAWGVAALDSVLHLRLASADELAAQVRATRGRPGASRARAALAFADAAAESALESLSRVRLAELGFPRPVLQYPVRKDGVLVARLDFAWPDLMLAGEADGAVKYRDGRFDDRTGAEVLLAEKERAGRLHDLGWTLVRWDLALLNAPGRFERRLRAGFEAARGRPAA